MCQIHVNIANSLCEGQLGDEFEVALDLAGNRSCAMVVFLLMAVVLVVGKTRTSGKSKKGGQFCVLRHLHLKIYFLS